VAVFTQVVVWLSIQPFKLGHSASCANQAVDVAVGCTGQRVTAHRVTETEPEGVVVSVSTETEQEASSCGHGSAS
jgi:hypothetical protein